VYNFLKAAIPFSISCAARFRTCSQLWIQLYIQRCKELSKQLCSLLCSQLCYEQRRQAMLRAKALTLLQRCQAMLRAKARQSETQQQQPEKVGSVVFPTCQLV
jgi:hypothetical protein